MLSFKNFITEEEIKPEMPATSWHDAIRTNVHNLPKYGHELAKDMLNDVYASATKRVKDKSLYGEMIGHLYNHMTYFGVPHDDPHLSQMREIMNREKENQ